MARALCLLREQLVYRRDAFRRGLTAAGYELVAKLDKPDPSDVVAVWNRYGFWHSEATRFEQAGARAVICENGYLGKDWLGGSWYAMAIGHHAGAGKWNVGGPERWDDLGVALEPWRTGGNETLILGQRGIGEPGIASPDGWAERTQRKIGGRIRPHPERRGAPAKSVPFAEDLANASSVVTWASSAALRALMMGVPVWHEMQKWIGRMAAYPLSAFGEHGYGPRRDDLDRLEMFQRLIWAQWRLEEIENGSAFRYLLARNDGKCDGPEGAEGVDGIP